MFINRGMFASLARGTACNDSWVGGILIVELNSEQRGQVSNSISIHAFAVIIDSLCIPPTPKFFAPGQSSLTVVPESDRGEQSCNRSHGVVDSGMMVVRFR